MKDMFPFEGYYESFSNDPFNGDHERGGELLIKSSSISSSGAEEEEEEERGSIYSKSPKLSKTEEACRKHAFAEQKRRERINRHYHTLRQLFPNLPKRDKASVLTETVRRVKELRRMVAEKAHSQNTEECGHVTTRRGWPFFLPSEHDEALVSYCNENEGKMVKATVCCDDRPGFNRELTEAMKSVGAKAVRAEMVTIGGRTKVVVVVQLREGGDGEEDVGSLRRALKAVVENRALGPSRLMGHIFPTSRWAGLGQDFSGTVNNGLSDGLLVRSSI